MQNLLFAFDGEHVVAALIADSLGGVHYPVHAQRFEQDRQGGDLWLDLSATRAWVRTVPVAWSRADRRCGARGLPQAGCAHGLAVHRDDCSSLDGAGTSAQPRPQTGVEVGGVQVLQDSADG